MTEQPPASSPAVWWSPEYQRFYALPGTPPLVEEVETRFMPSDIQPMVPATVQAWDPDDDDEGHGPWHYLDGGVLCSCGYPVDRDERCTRPRGAAAEHDAKVDALFEAVDSLLHLRSRGWEVTGDVYEELEAAHHALSDASSEPPGDTVPVPTAETAPQDGAS